MEDLLTFMAIGFFAQFVDGALGMAYGIISMGVLLSIGINPTAASASIHTAEIFTTGISGFSHAMFKNIDYRLCFRLILPGVIGSIIGAFFLTKVPPEKIKPFIAAYLLILGLIILYHAARKVHWMTRVDNLINKALGREKASHSWYRLIALGLFGGFCDASGGGGWGPVVSSSLLAQNQDEPRLAIGSTILAEFLVTLSSALTFSAILGISHWRIIVGLILGGVLAAPLAALTVKYLPAKFIMIFVGTIVLLMSIFMIVRVFSFNAFSFG